jgi:tripartite-type tricarboxylate transporter receptor subunit TctC
MSPPPNPTNVAANRAISESPRATAVDRHPKFTNADFIPLARIVADPIVLITSKDSPET